MSILFKDIIIYLLKVLLYMFKNQYSATKNVICLNLENASEKILQTWFVVNNDLANATKMYLKSIVRNNQECLKKSERVARVYLEDSYILLIMTEASLFEIDFGIDIEQNIKEIVKLSVDYNEELSQLITQIANRINNGQQLQLKESEVISLQYYQQQNNQQMSLMQLDNFKDVIALQIAGAMEIEIKKVTSLQAIKPIYSHFKKKPDCPKSILQDLKVQQLFYKGDLLIAYTIKHPNYEDELFCWSEDYENELSYVEPVTIESLVFKPTLNSILDKISEFGMTSLTDGEMQFLENIK